MTYTSLYLLKIIHINYWRYFLRYAIIYRYMHHNHVLIFMFPFRYDVDLKQRFLGSYSSWKLNLNRGNCRIFLSQQNLVYNRACHSVCSVLMWRQKSRDCIKKIEIASNYKEICKKAKSSFQKNVCDYKFYLRVKIFLYFIFFFSLY